MRTPAIRPVGKEATSAELHPLAELIEANLADYWLSLGSNPTGRVIDSGSIRCVYSGGAFFNRVVSAQLAPQDADLQINEIMRTFQEKRAAITWLTGPSTRPGDLGPRLESHGFYQYDPWKGMAHELENVDALPSLPPDIEVLPVTTTELREDWTSVICRSFGLPRAACEILPGGPLPDGTVWHHNLAYQSGVPVAAYTVFISQGVAGIYLVATVPEARNQGLGTAMTSLALRQAKEIGCKVAVLHATEPGRRIYENLGFRHYCDIGVYRFPAPSPLWKRLAGTILQRARRVRIRPEQQRTNGRFAEGHDGCQSFPAKYSMRANGHSGRSVREWIQRFVQS